MTRFQIALTVEAESVAEAAASVALDECGNYNEDILSLVVHPVRVPGHESS